MNWQNKSEVVCKSIEFSNLKYKKDTFGNSEIKVYKITLSDYLDDINTLSKHLRPLELDRANRFHFQKDKNRFIICRVLLKFLLAKQTGIRIDEIIIETNSNEKPYLPSHPSVYFNVSHAGDYGLIALADLPVGIDIEYINEDFDYMEILADVFSSKEIESITNTENKIHRFYQYWTRKEAIVKTSGKGLDEDIRQIPAMDGLHSVNSKLIDNYENLTVLSFDVDHTHIGAIAHQNNGSEPLKINFCPVPDILDQLK